MRLIKDFIYFIRDLFRSRNIIYELTKKDFKVRYLGSYLGIIWAFVQPVTNILVYWFVFQVGLRAPAVTNSPFILWLMCGMIPWSFISEGIIRSTHSIMENNYLVKKVVFRVSILPIVKVLSGLIIHVFFIVILFLVFMLYGYMPTIYSLQVVYYLFASVFIILAISWFTSSIVVFFKDLDQIIAIFMHILFLMTPIFWSINRLPDEVKILFKLNPFYYIVEGYRNALVDHQWFWTAQSSQTIYFWVVSLVLFLIGIFVFRKLRPHFADVL